MIRLGEIGEVMKKMDQLTVVRDPFKEMFDALANNPAVRLQAALSPITRQIEALTRMGEQIKACCSHPAVFLGRAS